MPTLIRAWAALCLTAFLAGCVPTGGVAWSPDGARGVYTDPAGVGRLLDGTGHITGDLGEPCVGGFSWTDDGKTLYFLRADKPVPEPTTRPTTGPAETARQSAPRHFRLCRWRDSKIETVLDVDGAPLTTAVSPGGRWVALGGQVGKDQGGGHYHGVLVVFDTLTSELHTVSEHCSMTATFTGPSRCSVVEIDTDNPQPADSETVMTGRLVEFDLTPLTRPRQSAAVRTVLDDAPCVVDDVPIAHAGPTLLYGRLDSAPIDRAHFKGASIYRFDFGTRRPVRLAESSAWAAASPDGSKIVLFTVASEMGKTVRVEVINPDGSGRSTVTAVLPLDGLGDLPTWHGNDRLTLTVPSDVILPETADHSATRVFDLTDYKLVGGKWVVDRVLSKDWPVDLKPNQPEPAKGNAILNTTVPSRF